MVPVIECSGGDGMVLMVLVMKTAMVTMAVKYSAHGMMEVTLIYRWEWRGVDSSVALQGMTVV